MPVERIEEAAQGAPQWIVTFSDMVSLLVTFFVLLLTFSTLEEEKLSPAFGSFRHVFGNTQEFKQIRNAVLERKGEISERNPWGAERPPLRKVEDVAGRLEIRIRKDPSEVPLDLERVRDGLSIRIDADLSFGWMSDRLHPRVEPTLLDLAEILSEADLPFIVAGHAGARFLQGRGFEDEIELSGARARAVASFLLENGSIHPRRVSVEAYGSLVARGSSEDRLHRRVEILVLGRPSGER